MCSVIDQRKTLAIAQSQQGLPPVEFVEILVQHLEKRCLILQVGPVILLYSILAYEDCDHGLIRQQDSASFIGRNPFEAWNIELGHQDESHHVADLKELLNNWTCAKRLEPNGYGYVYVYIDVVIQTLQIYIIYIADPNIAVSLHLEYPPLQSRFHRTLTPQIELHYTPCI